MCRRGWGEGAFPFPLHFAWAAVAWWARGGKDCALAGQGEGQHKDRKVVLGMGSCWGMSVGETVSVGGGGLARGHGVGLLAFGGAYWPLATAHPDPLWVRACFHCANGAPR